MKALSPAGRAWIAMPLAGALWSMAAPADAAAQDGRPHLPFGIFIGSIEEGARIFTPTRLLPLAHPEALGHDFPTTLVHHEAEAETLVLLGEHVGLHLRSTLQRYPRMPVDHWPYPEFSPPPVAQVRAAVVVALDTSCSPLPGLRVAAFQDRQPLSFIVDTRGMSLGERGMSRATSAGLDMSRQEFTDALAALAEHVPERGMAILAVNGSPPKCEEED